MNIIIAILVNSIAFYIGARLLSGVEIRNFWTAVILAIVVGLLNITLGFLLKVITLGLFTLWLFSLILDAILILVADWLLKGVKVRGFLWALLLALIVALINLAAGWIFG